MNVQIQGKGLLYLSNIVKFATNFDTQLRIFLKKSIQHNKKAIRMKFLIAEHVQYWSVETIYNEGIICVGIKIIIKTEGICGFTAYWRKI